MNGLQITRALYALFAGLTLTWSVLSVPFAFVLGTLISDSDSALVACARLLTAVGILLLGFGVFVGTAATLSLATTASAQDSVITAQQLKFWAQMRFYLTDPGLMAWGVGQVLYCWLLWRGRKLPVAVLVVGFLGGSAGFLTLAVYETQLLALVQLLSFAVLAAVVGVVLMRECQQLSTARDEA